MHAPSEPFLRGRTCSATGASLLSARSLEAAIPGSPRGDSAPSRLAIENVLERYGVDDIENIFRALVANRAVDVAGFSNDEMVVRLQRAWDVEPGYSKTAIFYWSPVVQAPSAAKLPSLPRPDSLYASSRILPQHAL